jgi:MSHA pilin protein MshC
MVIAAVLMAVAAPKFLSVGSDDRAFAEETASALRYAQRSALAMQRTVCAALTTTTVTLNYDSAYIASSCTASACGTALPGPGGGPGAGGATAYVVNAQHGRTFASATTITAPATPATISFDRCGRPTGVATTTLGDGRKVINISMSGQLRVQIDSETGYVQLF